MDEAIENVGQNISGCYQRDAPTMGDAIAKMMFNSILVGRVDYLTSLCRLTIGLFAPFPEFILHRSLRKGFMPLAQIIAVHILTKIIGFFPTKIMENFPALIVRTFPIVINNFHQLTDISWNKKNGWMKPSRR